MSTKRIYLAGPMKGIKNFNFTKFDVEAYKLRKQGWEVFSPADNDREQWGKDDKWMPTPDNMDDIKYDLRDILGQDLAWICRYADAIAMLPNWELSRGAIAEHALATALGLEIRYVG